jgi:hypothetical protein
MSLLTPSKVSYAASKLPPARLRIAEIFDELEKLTVEFGDLYEQAGIPSVVGNEVNDQLIETIVDMRNMLGDEIDDGEWIVAENAPKTLEELHAERWERIQGRVS